MDFFTEKFKTEYKMTPLDAGDAARLKVKPMNFAISHYDVIGYGHLSILQGTAMLGLMKMDTVIFAPTLKDAPLFSYDRINAMGNDIFIIELYDTLLNKELAAGYEAMCSLKDSLKTIADNDLGKHWYDYMKLPASMAKKGKKCKEAFDKTYAAYFDEYLARLSKAPDCSMEDKKQKTAEYVNGLFENGGPSTDKFVKALGRARAEEIFRGIVFGC